MPPEKIGRYEVKSEIGRGGMATVYEAYDPLFKRDVAIKVLPRELLHDPTFRARFEREAQVIASLEHPAIVPVYDFGEEDGDPYLVMRLLSGGSLATRLASGPLSLLEATRIFSHIAPGLDEAHAKGIIHRDLKPGNILFDRRNDPYISDFGIVKLSEGSVAYTGNVIMGTPAYMSPEQARGDPTLDGRSDIYSLGVILFEMLTGQQPYYADTPMGVAVKQISEPPPHILEVKPDLPAEVDRIISRALAKNPDERYSTAHELAEELSGLGAQQAPVVASPFQKTLVGTPGSPSPQSPTPISRTPTPQKAAPIAVVTGPPAVQGRRVPGWTWIVGSIVLIALIFGLLVVSGTFASFAARPGVSQFDATATAIHSGPGIPSLEATATAIHSGPGIPSVDATATALHSASPTHQPVPTHAPTATPHP